VFIRKDLLRIVCCNDLQLLAIICNDLQFFVLSDYYSLLRRNKSIKSESNKLRDSYDKIVEQKHERIEKSNKELTDHNEIKDSYMDYVEEIIDDVKRERKEQIKLTDKLHKPNIETEIPDFNKPYNKLVDDIVNDLIKQRDERNKKFFR